MRHFLECASFPAGSTSMDFAYLLFLLVLAAAVLGFLLICDRLGPRR